MIRIVLASRSPRRRALLAALGLSFDIETSEVDEILEGVPAETVVVNARAKRDDIAARMRARSDAPSLVIAADTLVFLDGRPLGKPADLEEARDMLRRLSGNTHQVLTGLALVDTGTEQTAEGFESTDVTFRTLTAREIDLFAEAVNPVDRAGAYTVDGPGSLLVERYDGCYQNVLGLPIVRLDCLLRELGYSLFELMDGRQSIYL